MKISELKETREVNRPRKDSFGKRVYEKMKFELKLNWKDKYINRRLFSKVIDITFVIFLQTLIYRIGFINPENYLLDFLIFVAFMFLMNSILESLIGFSLGKLIFNLRVINDNCQNISLIKSLNKNLLSIGTLLLLPFSHLFVGLGDYYQNWLIKKKIYIVTTQVKKNLIKKIKD
jgi:RDD family